MAEDDQEGEWPQPLMIFTPMATLDPALSARLVDRYLDVLREPLTVDEREYADEYAPPQIDIGVEPSGERLLSISFGGAVTLMGWDGTEESALRLVSGVAANAAHSASADHWLAEGWRTRTTFPADEPDQ